MKSFRRTISIVWIVGIITLCVSQSASACTPIVNTRPATRAADVIDQLFKEKNYRELDRLSAKYVKEKTATPDGTSALSAFYKGVARSSSGCSSSSRPEEEWIALEDALLAWKKASPTSDGAQFAVALFHIAYAWHERGGGYISTVNDVSLNKFESRMAIAKRELDALAERGKNNPAWYAGMLSVAVAQGWPSGTVDALYAKALTLDPYYTDIHFSYTEYYRQRWYGSDEQNYAAIDRATESTKQRMGQSMYAVLHWGESKSSDMFSPGKVSWEKMKAGFDDFLAIYAENHTRSHYAGFACTANDAKTLKQQLALLEGEIDLLAWNNEGRYKYCVALAKHAEDGKKPACFKVKDTGMIICD